MSINTSSIVYAYADEFLEPRKRGVELPCREVRVKKQDLATTAMTAAFIELAEAGHARLNVGTHGALLGLRKHTAVFVERLGGGASIGGLEGGLLASLSDNAEENSVRDIVERFLPTTGDPWRDVISRIQEGMLKEGYFLEGERKKRIARFFLGKKLNPDCQRIASLREQVTSVRDMVDKFRETNETLYEQLIRDVRQGIRAREDADMGMD